MIIPYKVKNPPKSFPIATVTLIGLNVFVFAVTSHFFLVVRQPIVEEYALRWGESALVTLLTSVFLHADIFHLAGNMLFLWVFGPAVEDRLGVGLYLFLYFLSGFAGDVFHAALGSAGAIGASVPMLGASGCIMGVLGAYWYMYSWSPVCVFYWIAWFWRGTFEIAAVWVIGAYFVLDLLNGLVVRAAEVSGGVANFAHVGGVIAGLALVWGLGKKRDSSEVSMIKAAHSDVADIGMLGLMELSSLLRDAPEDEELLTTYCVKAMHEGQAPNVRLALDANLRGVLSVCPEAAARYLVVMRGEPDVFSSGDLVYLARWCEDNDRASMALSIYDVIEANHWNAPELEMALYRAALAWWRGMENSKRALAKLEALLTKFPHGALMFEAEDLRDEILRSTSEQGGRAA